MMTGRVSVCISSVCVQSLLRSAAASNHSFRHRFYQSLAFSYQLNFLPLIKSGSFRLRYCQIDDSVTYGMRTQTGCLVFRNIHKTTLSSAEGHTYLALRKETWLILTTKVIGPPCDLEASSRTLLSISREGSTLAVIPCLVIPLSIHLACTYILLTSDDVWLRIYNLFYTSNQTSILKAPYGYYYPCIIYKFMFKYPGTIATRTTAAKE